VYGLGTGRETFADLVDTGYLPQARARVCRVEFGEVNFAFQQTLQRHVDRDMAKSGNCYGWICRSPPSSVAPDGRRIRSRSELGGTGGDPDHRVVKPKNPHGPPIGSTCVAEAERGQRLATALFAELRERLPGR